MTIWKFSFLTYRAVMAKPSLNQRILQSAGRKRVNIGVFLKGEDSIPVFFLKSYAVMLQILVCMIYFYVTNVLLIKVKLESLNYNQDFYLIFLHACIHYKKSIHNLQIYKVLRGSISLKILMVFNL